MAKTSTAMNVARGVAGGMLAGMAVGYVGKKMIDGKPKMKKKANKMIGTMGTILDTAQYMFK